MGLFRNSWKLFITHKSLCWGYAMNYKYDKVFPFLQLFVNYSRRLRPVRVDGGIFIFFFQTNWPRNQAHSLYFAFILINLLVTTSANLFFVGWSVISCSAWSSRTCNKFCSPVRNSFHNQAFLEIFPGLQF